MPYGVKRGLKTPGEYGFSDLAGLGLAGAAGIVAALITDYQQSAEASALYTLNRWAVSGGELLGYSSIPLWAVILGLIGIGAGSIFYFQPITRQGAFAQGFGLLAVVMTAIPSDLAGGLEDILDDGNLPGLRAPIGPSASVIDNNTIVFTQLSNEISNSIDSNNLALTTVSERNKNVITGKVINITPEIQALGRSEGLTPISQLVIDEAQNNQKSIQLINDDGKSVKLEQASFDVSADTGFNNNANENLSARISGSKKATRDFVWKIKSSLVSDSRNARSSLTTSDPVTNRVHLGTVAATTQSTASNLLQNDDGVAQYNVRLMLTFEDGLPDDVTTLIRRGQLRGRLHNEQTGQTYNLFRNAGGVLRQDGNVLIIDAGVPARSTEARLWVRIECTKHKIEVQSAQATLGAILDWPIVIKTSSTPMFLQRLNRVYWF